jgi:hypothetical protein
MEREPRGPEQGPQIRLSEEQQRELAARAHALGEQVFLRVAELLDKQSATTQSTADMAGLMRGAKDIESLVFSTCCDLLDVGQSARDHVLLSDYGDDT